MKQLGKIAGILLFILIGSQPVLARQALIGARYPALSPDGKTVAFSYLGDIWTVPVSGGEATRLTDNEAYDQRPLWSPKGDFLVFTSDRFGENDVFVLPKNGGPLRRLTYNSANDIATDVSPDGKWVLFESNRSSFSGLFRVPVQGGTPEPVVDAYWVWTYSGKWSPNGKEVLFSQGMENRYWWRKGYRGANSAKLWRFNLKTGKALQITFDDQDAFWPNWGGSGQKIYFVSERKTGVYNIWSCDPNGKNLRAVTRFKKGEVWWLHVAKKAPLAVYERNFRLYLTNLTSGKSRPISVLAPADLKTNPQFAAKNLKISEFRLSPDGKKIAAVARGEIFVMSAKGGYARNVTHTPWRERDVCWDSASKHLVFVSDRDGNPELYRISAKGDSTAKRLTHSAEDELHPRISPDGKWLAYFRGKRQLRLMKPDGSGDHLLIEDDFGGRFGEGFRWSPDSRFLAVVTQKMGNENIYAVNVTTGDTTHLTNTAYDENGPVWAPNGKSLLYLANRFGHSFPEFTGKWDIYQVLFKPQKPKFEEDKFEKLFAPEKKTAKGKKKSKKKITVAFDLRNLQKQTLPVTQTLGNEQEFVISTKDTSTVYFVSTIDGKRHLWKTSLDEKKRGKFSPFAPGVLNPSQLQMGPKGKKLYYLSSGRIGELALPAGKPKSIAFSAHLKVNRLADYEQLLREVFYTLKYYYYDPTFHHKNWEKVYQSYRPVLQQVKEDRDFYDYVNEMIGELNSSHTGIYPPPSHRPAENTAFLGANFGVRGGRLILTHIFANGPLALFADSVHVGDALVQLNGKPISAQDNVWKFLNGKLNRRLELTFRNPKTGKHVAVKLKGISQHQQNELALQEWVDSRKERVRRLTHDQVAYIYMRAMGQSDLKKFLLQLERDAVPRKGLILDIRFNFGGNVHDRVLGALLKPVYAKWKIRGLSETQQSTFGFADKPVVLMTNEVTLSDGEMTANGFKTLKRGPIVGNTTYGWLIFTSGMRLMNGAYVRLPFWGCYTLSGRDLETQGGVQPDVRIVNRVPDWLGNKDPQLDKAVQVILKKIGK